jgi:hypothetical protein
MRLTSEISSNFAGAVTSISTHTTRRTRAKFQDYFTQRFWHFGQKCDERCATSRRRMGVPHVTQGSPVRW